MIFALTEKGRIIVMKDSDPTPPGAVAFSRPGFKGWITGREEKYELGVPYRSNVFRDINDVVERSEARFAVNPLFDDETTASGPYVSGE